SRMSSIRSAAASSRVWQSQPATPPGFRCSNTASVENGWSCSKKSRRVTRVAVLRDPALASGGGQLDALQALASSFGVELSPVGVRDASEIERAVAAFARSPNGGLIVTGSTLAVAHRDLIITLAPAPAACSLRPALHRGRRRPNLLWP